MPRITEERRAARRAEITAAARRCFSRDGFHRTSMPDIAAEAGVSTGAPYRYFAGKDELILEIAGQAFRVLLGPLLALVERGEALGLSDLAVAALAGADVETETDAAGDPVPVDELLRCVVQAWAELLRDDAVRAEARAGVARARDLLAHALHDGQARGLVDDHLDVDSTTRMLVALLHGAVLQRVAFELDGAGRHRLLDLVHTTFA